MTHFDNGHLSDHNELLPDHFAHKSVLAFLVGIEAIGLGFLIFAIVHLFRWAVA